MDRAITSRAEWLAWHTAILRVRQQEIVPRLAGIGGWSGRVLRLGYRGPGGLDVRGGAGLTRAILPETPLHRPVAPVDG